MTLVIGANSRIGSEYIKQILKNKNYFATSRRKFIHRNWIYLDLSKKSNVQNFKIPPQVTNAVIFAGYTNESLCKANPLASRSVNVTHMKLMIKKLLKAGIFTLFISSDYAVSAGKGRFRKVSLYAMHKREIETFLKTQDKNLWAILRISKVSSSLEELFTKWLDNLLMGQPLMVYSNVRVSVVSEAQVLYTIKSILEKQATGFWNLTASDRVSYVRIAQVLYAFIKKRKNISDKLTFDLKRSDIRLGSRLKIEKTVRVFKLKPKTSLNAVRNYLKMRYE